MTPKRAFSYGISFPGVQKNTENVVDIVNFNRMLCKLCTTSCVHFDVIRKFLTLRSQSNISAKYKANQKIILITGNSFMLTKRNIVAVTGAVVCRMVEKHF